jgi:hypothetical protein
MKTLNKMVVIEIIKKRMVRIYDETKENKLNFSELSENNKSLFESLITKTGFNTPATKGDLIITKIGDTTKVLGIEELTESEINSINQVMSNLLT